MKPVSSQIAEDIVEGDLPSTKPPAQLIREGGAIIMDVSEVGAAVKRAFVGT